MTPKDQREKSVSALLNLCGVIFAFSDQQLKDGIQKLKDTGKLLEGDRMCDIGAGGFMPSKNREAFDAGMAQIKKEFKEAMQDQEAREKHIAYELWNHECYLEDTMDALGEDFTMAEVVQVAKKKRISLN